MTMRDKMVMDTRRGYNAEPELIAPFLKQQGKHERIVIPSPKRSAILVQRMRAYGFTFRAHGEHGATWVRFTDQKLNGKLWSGEHWLELAQKCHQEAYGDMEPLFTEA